MADPKVIEAPDGTELEFPANMSDDAIAKIMAEKFPPTNYAEMAAALSPIDLSFARGKNNAFGAYLRKEALKPRPGESEEARFRRLYGGRLSRPEVGGLESASRALCQGMTFGGCDELVAAGAAGLNRLLGKDPGHSFGELYDVYLARERAKINEYRRVNPVMAYANEIGGALPTSLLLPQVPAGGPILRGAGTGGYQGGLYGFLGSEGNGGQRYVGAGYGAGLGGGLGAVGPPIGDVLKRVWSRLFGTRKAAQKAGMSPAAYDTVRNVLSGDDSLRTGAQNIKRGGPDAMVADAGPNARALLDVAMQRTGAGARAARDAVEQRAANVRARLSEVMDSVLGTPVGARTQARSVAQGTRGARDDAYREAYTTPIDYSSRAGRAIEDVFGRVPKRIMDKAIQDANEMIQMSPDPLIKQTRQIIAEVSDDGVVKFSEVPNVIQLDYIKRALGEISADAVDQFGRLTGLGSRVGALASDLRDAIKNAVPAYGKALAVSSDKIERDQAIRLGQNILKRSTTLEMVGEQVARMTAGARKELLRSMRSYIDDQIANVRAAISDPNVDAREAAAAVAQLSSRAARDKIRLAIGNDEKAELLFEQLRQAAQSLGVRASVAQNSKTFPRQVLDETVQNITRSGPVGRLLEGNPMQSARVLVQSLTGRTAAEQDRVTQAVYSDIARALTGPRAKDAIAFIQALERAAVNLAPKEQAIQRLVRSLLARNAAISQPPLQDLRPSR